jgi:asparagine synthase (glutamine-hydrolysing)
MCGIAGKIAVSSREAAVDADIVRRMMSLIVHRGPDDEGIYIDRQAVLGHRRLSIIDLNTGKQPISNEDGTVWVVYNGEIYNFPELREQLLARGHILKTHTDTEVIVHLYEDYGEQCVTHLRGMFAFALWDVRKRKLLLARDRVGIKPLYYVQTNNSLLFASEIKAFRADPSVQLELNPQAIDTFLTFLYVPGTETLFRNVRKLDPGHYLVMEDGRVKVSRYWDLKFTAPESNGHFRDSAEALHEMLQQTVRDHMISDVPVGVLLSGGVDSTALLSFAVNETQKKISSFTIGFEGQNFADERPYAKLAAEQFGTEHHEMTITAQDFLAFLPKYVWHMEEPVCEPPAVGLYYVTKLASAHVKVLLSGEGGDEAFAGYQNYRNMLWLERLRVVGQPWTGLAAGAFDGLGHVSERLGKYSGMLKLPLEDYYYGRTAGPSSFFNRNKAKLYSTQFAQSVEITISPRRIKELFSHVADQPALNKMLYIDTKTWLPDDLLIKADKISMANSLELRVPFLDHKVLEFAAGLPINYKVRGFTTKYILKEALQGRIPQPIISRKKTGFPIPVESWITNELSGFVHDVLMDRRTLDRGYFEREFIEAMIKDGQQREKYAANIFSLVILELWHRSFVDAAPNRLEN